MELRNGKKLSQPRYTLQRIAWEDKKQQISAAEAMVKLFNELCLKNAFQKLRTAANSPRMFSFSWLEKVQQQLSIYDRWHMDSEISGRL